MKNTLVCVVVAARRVPSISSAAIDTTEEKLYELNALVAYLERIIGFVPEQALTADDMRQIVVDGTRFLARSQESTGHFAYEFDPYSGVYLDDDNIVRQAGALYQLGEVVRRDTAGTLELDETIELSIAYFEELSREDTFNDITFRCIVESETSTRCKLGATSLALIGILSYVDAFPQKERVYADLIADYVSYIVASKIEGEGFRNIHRVEQESQSEKESSFSNGEATLALARYYQYKNDPEIQTLALDMFAYLQDYEFDSPLYLWVMAALKDMQKIWPNDSYVAYAKEYTDWRVQNVQRYRDTKNNYCAYAEGIVSAYSILEDTLSAEEQTELRREIDFWNNKNRRLQIDALDVYRYEVAHDTLLKLSIDTPALEQAHGGFLTSDTVLTERIDFTQHCISAYLQVLVDIDNETL